MEHTDASNSAPGASNSAGDRPQLSDDDLHRVEKYLSSPVHQIERKPFRPWLMMAGLVATVVLLSLLSWLISYLVLG